MERVKECPLSAFLPQKGPLSIAGSPDEAPETISRSRAWELVYSELSTLDDARGPLRDLRNVPVEVSITVARNEFPLTIPPRWLGELFPMASRVVALKMKANNWSLGVPPGMGADCRDYISAALTKVGNDRHRSRRQWFNLRVQEDETLMDDSEMPLVWPDVDRAVPPVPAGLVAHRP